MLNLTKTVFLKDLLLIIILSLMTYSSLYAKVHDFETTRLKSTAGAGVGSILMDESTILNPAPIAFFNVSSIYLQKTKIDITPKDKKLRSSYPESDLMGIIISDSNKNLSGSLSYQKQKEKYDERERLALSLASPIKGKSSLGLAYRFTKDKDSSDGKIYTEDKYHQFLLGVTHAIKSYLTVGMVISQPHKIKALDNFAIVGFQYLFKDMISIMVDSGANYFENLSNTLLLRSALQLKIFQDFFLRFGMFRDRGKGERGNGVGLGWVGPRLVFDLAFKNTTVSENLDKKQPNDNIKETSFSLSYRF